MRKILITGASNGLGFALAEHFLSNGETVVINTRTPTTAELTEKKIAANKFKGKHLIIPADVKNRKQVKNLFALANEKVGQIEVIINCAGINIDKSFMQMDDESWDKVVDTHLKGTFISSQEFSKQYAGESGHIVTLGAGCGIQGRLNGANFCSAKGGILALTKCMARELAPRIAVNCLTPSAVDTAEVVSRYNLNTQEGLKKVLSGIPLDRLGKREDVIQMTESILSSKFTTGSNFFVNGGELMY